ncbi:MAG: PP2C family protein-serine/threonine phosphatase [Bacteroidia bacterium]|nr:PP2C family protein-serine/threonine phosphatase [Bacteroidia bacterium]
MKNAYDTNDPKKLLDLKRLEAAALLDVLRTINHYERNIPQLCTIAKNVLRAQLGVKKMGFFYETGEVWVQGIHLGFPPFGEEMMEEMLVLTKTTRIRKKNQPCLFELGVEYVIPIINRGMSKVFFCVADFADSEVETENDLIFIETLGNILSVAITNKQLFQEKIQQEFLRKELEVAETIQKQLLISDFSRFREIDVFGMNIAHHGVGGDFYDVIKKGRGNTIICIADVSGKGIGAALLMSNLQANLRALSAQYDDLASIIRDLNKILYDITTGEKFVTLFIAKINASNKTITYINAGHNYPVFFSGEEVHRLESGCTILGIIPSFEIQESELTFSSGDILFTFTDGVVEQSNAAGDMFGSERLIDKLKGIRDKNARDMVQLVEEELAGFAGSEDATDDVTMLSVKFL